ncbi:histidine phosphatase family protein [Asaia bogorensis]|uniref:SixA phosphatase family protein n=1 Tax=Asaia bogorensis TaxID=91915 RepID=UPI000EFAF7D2|nr:histidine phosphatase family protein [Asaia bogorensis]
MTLHHLFLVRHAQAVPEIPGGSDRERRLTATGEQDARSLAEKIAALDVPLDRVHLWHSTASRTAQTASLIGEALPDTCVSFGLDALYDLDLYGILELLRETPQSVGTLIIVGHNPAIAQTCRHLASNAIDGPVARELMESYEPGTATLFTIASDWAGLSPNTAGLGSVLHP